MYKLKKNPPRSLLQAPVRIGVIFKHLRKLIDSLLEKKLENPRMNLEGKLEHLNTNIPFFGRIQIQIYMPALYNNYILKIITAVDEYFQNTQTIT